MSPDMEGRAIDVDLSKIEFFEPFGLVYAYVVVRQLHADGAREVSVVLPTGDVGNYLDRIDFTRALLALPNTSLRNLMSSNKNDRSDRLLEFESFTVSNDDEVEELASRMRRIITTQAPEARAIGEQIHMTLAELISNVEVHSDTREGVAVAQTINGRVHICIADAGVGIPSRIRSLDPTLRDAACIEEATKARVTTRLGRGGMGLTELRTEIREGGGRLSIRSGSGMVDFYRSGASASFDDLTPFRGTIVEACWV